MYSFLYSIGNKIHEIFQDLGYFDRNEISNLNAKYIPGLEIQLLQQCINEYHVDYDSLNSICFNNEIGIFYKLKYGEIGAKMMYKPRLIAHFIGSMRLYYSDYYGLDLNSSGIVDFNGKTLDKCNVGFTGIVGNVSAQLKLYADNFVFSTRHRIHWRFISLSEVNIPYTMDSYSLTLKPTLAIGFEFELSSKTILEMMVSDFCPPTFALQYQFVNRCLLRFFGDMHSRKTGVSLAFPPSSNFSS